MMMVTQKPEINLGESIERLNQAFIVGYPLPGVPELGGSQKDGLRLVLIAMGQIIIRAMKLGAFRVMATAIKIAASVSVLPDGSP